MSTVRQCSFAVFGVWRPWLLRRDELTAALDAKSDANCQLEGLKELAKHLQARAQRHRATMRRATLWAGQLQTLL